MGKWNFTPLNSVFLIYHLKASKQNTLFSLPRCKYLEKGRKMIAMHRKRDNRPTSFQICCLNSVLLGVLDMLAEEKHNVSWRRRRKIKVSEKYVRRPQLLASLWEEAVLTQFKQRYVFFQKNSVRTGGIYYSRKTCNRRPVRPCKKILALPIERSFK